MSAGDVTLFNAVSETIGDGTLDLDGHNLKMFLITNGITPTAGDTTPTYSDYSSYEVTGTGYTAGGIALTSVVWSRTDDVTKLDADDGHWDYNAAGPTNAYTAIIYDDDATAKDCICFIDLGGPLSLQVDDIDVIFNTSGIFFQQANAA